MRPGWTVRREACDTSLASAIGLVPVVLWPGPGGSLGARECTTGAEFPAADLRFLRERLPPILFWMASLAYQPGSGTSEFRNWAANNFAHQ